MVVQLRRTGAVALNVTLRAARPRGRRELGGAGVDFGCRSASLALADDEDTVQLPATEALPRQSGGLGGAGGDSGGRQEGYRATLPPRGGAEVLGPFGGRGGRERRVGRGDCVGGSDGRHGETEQGEEGDHGEVHSDECGRVSRSLVGKTLRLKKTEPAAGGLFYIVSKR